MIHSLSKEVTASCAFTTGIWDSLGAHSKRQKAKKPSWHTELVVAMDKKHNLYPKLFAKSSLFDEQKCI